MTPAPPQRRIWQQCNTAFLQTARPGRPSTMCSEVCKRASRRKNGAAPDLTGAETDMNEAAEDLNRVASALLASAQGRAPASHLLGHITVLQRLVADAEAAAIRHGRLKGNSWDTLAEPMGLSAERLRKKWSEQRLTRRLDTRRNARNPTMPAPAHQFEAGAASPFAAAPSHTPTQTPAQQLAAAFSHLQRASGRTLKEIATDSDISSSYLSRILSGERTPAWNVAARLTRTYRASPEELRDLWEATQRPPNTEVSLRPPAPHRRNGAKRRFQVALRALYLAADRPHLWTVQRDTGKTLTVATIASALNGSIVPNWPTTSRLIAALNGCPGDFWHIWEAAYEHDDQGPQLPAGAFG